MKVSFARVSRLIAMPHGNREDLADHDGVALTLCNQIVE